MTSLQCKPLITGLLGMTLLSGCVKPAPSMTHQHEAAATLAIAEVSVLDLVVQASGNGPAMGWKASDIDFYRVTLRDGAGKEVIFTVPKSQNKVIFENLKLGETYTAKVEALNGSRVINLDHPSTTTFTFTGTQDVENLKTLPIAITLDIVRFSGTVKIPMNRDFFRDVFGENKYFNNSTKLEWHLKRLEGAESYTDTYDKPATNYKNYLLTNLGYGYTYQLTLTNYYKDGNKTLSQSKTTKEFTPFDNASSNAEYLLKKSDFQ